MPYCDSFDTPKQFSLRSPPVKGKRSKSPLPSVTRRGSGKALQKQRGCSTAKCPESREIQCPAACGRAADGAKGEGMLSLLVSPIRGLRVKADFWRNAHPIR